MVPNCPFSPVSISIAAAMQLRLPGTAGRVARKMRYIDDVAPRFRAGGLIRDVPGTRFERLWAVRVASVSNSIPAFGGVLYGAAALRQDVNLVEGKTTPSYQDSQVNVADMTFVQTSNRLVWKEYHLVYSLLEALFEEATLPDLILLDLPLLIVRGLHVATLADDVRNEWNDLLDLMTRFWGRYAGHCFPSNPKGPLTIARDIGDRAGKGARLGNLGIVYDYLGSGLCYQTADHASGDAAGDRPVAEGVEEAARREAQRDTREATTHHTGAGGQGGSVGQRTGKYLGSAGRKRGSPI